MPMYGWRYPLVGKSVIRCICGFRLADFCVDKALHLLELAKIMHNAHLASGSLSRNTHGQSDHKPPELLLQATVFLAWARESLQCSVAGGGVLSGQGKDGGPHGEIVILEKVLEAEWAIVLDKHEQ